MLNDWSFTIQGVPLLGGDKGVGKCCQAIDIYSFEGSYNRTRIRQIRSRSAALLRNA